MSTPSELNDAPSVQVSIAWQRKFELLEKVGADSSHIYQVDRNKVKELSWRERFSIQYNIFAFLFTFFYYAAKGMWLKAAFIFSASVLLGVCLVIVETALQIQISESLYTIPVSALCASMANYDYYQYVKKGKKGWGSSTSILSNNIVGSIAFAISLLILVLSMLSTEEYSDQVQVGAESLYSDVSGVWRSPADNTLLTVDFMSTETKTITVGPNRDLVPVEVSQVDLDNEIISLHVLGHSSDQIITVRKIYTDENSFRINMIFPNGASFDLDFVRNL
ncbi:DUF2628 domain-containing protein [Marinomonas agarivorans]|nr:DUF2628 domain-containing protein [Marinomonas agarivorans]